MPALFLYLRTKKPRSHYALIPAHLPANVSVEQIDTSALLQNWCAVSVRNQLQAIGGEWLREARSCVLMVPIAVMSAEHNFLINPLHDDFRLIVQGEAEMLETDMRLLRDAVGELIG